jgi:sulfate transport system substrate-binding protein
MSTKAVERIRNSLPEFLVGVAAIVVGVILLVMAAQALAAPARASARTGGTRLSLVASSSPPNAFSALISGFRGTSGGAAVSIGHAYGSSPKLLQSLTGGRAADVVSLGDSADMDQLASAGVISQSWAAGRYHGTYADSVVTFVVRKGNPQGVKTWRDIAQPNIEVILPNPFYADWGPWDVAAAYGAQRVLGKTDAQAIDYLTSLFRNVGVQDPTDAQAVKTFLGGEGDVLLAPESEAIALKRAGKADYVVPDETLLMEMPAAVTAKSAHPAQAAAFLSYLTSAPAQQALTRLGLRPVMSGIAAKGAFPHPAHLFPIGRIGGWAAAQKRLFDPTSGAVATIEAGLGIATGSAPAA